MAATNLGFGIVLLNVIWTLYDIGSASFSLYTDELDHTTAWLWIGAYSLNLFLNVFLFVRLPKSDLLAIQSWFSFTIVLLLLRVLCIDFMELSNYELYPYIVINVYIFVSLIVMAIVYVKVRGNKSYKPPKQVLQTVNYILTTNQTVKRTKPARINAPVISRPFVGRANRNSIARLEGGTWHETPHPDHSLNSSASFNNFMLSALQTSSSAGDSSCFENVVGGGNGGGVNRSSGEGDEDSGGGHYDCD
ncbi:uncharacterized protein [Drosophila virilis]|uniref:Uncharacterized protein, isoform A n=1 Tax=Drosophila virilis TaxID=7244 RepID=B4LN12_DROVI|nr:uncharacterized protein LOC6626674 isoform X2 [Drosophila virilis]XP_032291917.1 uncharacterized protein LOC6626674 isoform X2 [Drosophila virilis]EDW62127.1 uncharacterized protein Dvir_GJ22422, isoform A [Drosophila virilis]